MAYNQNKYYNCKLCYVEDDLDEHKTNGIFCAYNYPTV